MKILIAALFVFALYFNAFAQTETQAEVVVPNTFIRKAPNTGAEKLSTVERGDRFTVDKNREGNGWYFVTRADGKLKGWINANTVRLSTVAAAAAARTASRNVSAPETRPKPAPEIPKNAPPARASTPPQTSAEPNAVKSGAVSVSRSAAMPTAEPLPAPTPAALVPEESEEIVRVETEEIILNVRVVDSGNRPVKNLTPAQFQIFEDGELQEITSLTTTEVPVVNALLIDNSRSLRSQLSKVVEAGKIVGSANRPQDSTAVVRFVSSDKIEVLQDFTGNQNSVSAALDNLFIEGGQTAIIDAVYKTAQKVSQFQDAGGKQDVKVRAVIVVSDGDDRGSSRTEQQLFDLLRTLDVQIYAIGFPNDLSAEPDSNGVSRRDKAQSLLEGLAEETGGKVFFPASLEDLPRIAKEISDELRTQYQISYVPNTEAVRGTFKRINVKIAEGANNEQRTAITRAGRTVAP